MPKIYFREEFLRHVFRCLLFNPLMAFSMVPIAARSFCLMSSAIFVATSSLEDSFLMSFASFAQIEFAFSRHCFSFSSFRFLRSSLLLA